MSLPRQPNFRLFWIGETVNGAGTSMAAVVVPLLAVTVLRASTFAVAALTSAAYLPWLAIGLPAAPGVDRLPARPLIIACDTVAALPAGALGTALGVRDGLWLVQVLFAASGLLLLTRDIRTVSNLPSRR